MPDKYDKAIDYLTENPDQIWNSWNEPHSYPQGCLFMYVSKTEHTANNIGCLTTIRRNDGFGKVACTPELTEAIRADERIPKGARDIKVEDLPVFAEWQRRLDKELNRV